MASGTGNGNAGDAIVIGAGIIGSTIALRLAQAGLKVSVIDRGEPGGEASGAAAGMIAPFGEKIEPGPFFDLCLASHRLYPDFVREVEYLSRTRVHYRCPGTLLVGASNEEESELAAIAATQQKLGLPHEQLSGDEARKRLPSLSPDVRSALFIPGDHWVDNELLTQAVVSAAQLEDVSFFSRSPVRKLNVRHGRVESVEVGAAGLGPGGTFCAGQFILAAGCWSAGLLKPLGLLLDTRPCRGQMIEFDSGADLPLVVRAGHHYLVPRAGGRVVAGTTAEYTGFEKAVTGAGLRSILEGVERLVPAVRGFRFLRAWAGLRPDTADHLPVLGRTELPNLIIATGHFRNGILLAPITARLTAELVLSGSTPLALQAYNPARFTARSV